VHDHDARQPEVEREQQQQRRVERRARRLRALHEQQRKRRREQGSDVERVQREQRVRRAVDVQAEHDGEEDQEDGDQRAGACDRGQQLRSGRRRLVHVEGTGQRTECWWREQRERCRREHHHQRLPHDGPAAAGDASQRVGLGGKVLRCLLRSSLRRQLGQESVRTQLQRMLPE